MSNTICIYVFFFIDHSQNKHHCFSIVTHQTQNEIVIFDKVSLNEGNAYNVTSGIFIVLADWIYSFSWTILTKGGGYFITGIMLNGRPIALNYTDERGRRVGYAMSSSHFNIKMIMNDRWWSVDTSWWHPWAVCLWWRVVIFFRTKSKIEIITTLNI